MIKILNANQVEDSFFEGRDFGTTIDTVRQVLVDVKARKDQALHHYAAQFDVSDPEVFEIPVATLKAAAEKMQTETPDLYNSLCLSRDLALDFAKKQRESFNDFETELRPGLFTGQKNIPVEKVGVYVPAGRFPLVSTVVMTITPAVAAGVDEIILCTPPRVHPDDMARAEKEGLGKFRSALKGGKPYADEKIMAAAYLCGVNRVFSCGGSQAIAAMAFGTESIPKVDVVAGPGNKYVAEAKKLVYGTVGIDMIAGPTEVFIIADSTANPVWVAADLLAQAEHDVVAQPILATNDRSLAQKVSDEIERQIQTLSTKETARKSIDTYGIIIITDTLEEAAEIANRRAPEHLELAMEAGSLRDKLQNMARDYGSMFIGHGTAEVFGDYAAGLNHTLPTSGSARFTGGLSVRMFLKTVTTLRVKEGEKGVKDSAVAAGFLGDAEGLAGHARAARLRLGQGV